MTFQKHEHDFLVSFLGKKCLIRVEEDLEVNGRLERFQIESKREHRPFILVVKTTGGKVVIRGNWIAVKVI